MTWRERARRPGAGGLHALLPWCFRLCGEQCRCFALACRVAWPRASSPSDGRFAVFFLIGSRATGAATTGALGPGFGAGADVLCDADCETLDFTFGVLVA